MEPLVPPPPPLPPPPGVVVRTAREGELTPAWRAVLAVGWGGVVLGFAAIWRTGRTLGLSPWWLGPPAEPNLIVVQLLPFVLPVAMIVATLRNLRHLPVLGTAAGALMLGVGVFDLGRFTALALVELAVAAAGLLVSVAAFAGVLRAVDEPDAAVAGGASAATPAGADPATAG